MIKERFGMNTSLYHNSHYNNRHQMVTTRVGDSATDEWNWSRGVIDFFYGTTAVASGNYFANDTDNNGNLRRQTTYVPLAGGGYVIPQRDDYAYDALNRVGSVTEAQRDSSGQWALNVAWQNFSYDRYGNRQITSASGGVNNYNPIYNQASNRINGLGYDAAGNITSDPMTGGLMTYDAENRMLTATNGGLSSSYTYDAAGKRVRRNIGVQETWHVYGLGGELLAEYAAGAAPSAPQKEYGYRNGQLLVIAEPGSGGNLAWGKATSQSSTGFGGESSRGVDGNTSGNLGNNSVTHTNFEHQPWWQVDLGSVQQLGTVKLWNRTDCCSDRLSNFYVLVSDNPFSSTDLTTTINQAGVSSYYTAGPAGLLTEIGVGRSGRYVRLQLAGDNYLQLAEVEVMAGTASGVGAKWLMTDHLGSTRMVIDQTGSLAGITRHDFLPFGEELFAGPGIRSASNGYSGDSVRQKYTCYERDSETTLDYAQARYYASTEGRFTSIDPINITANRLIDPQGINLYSYARNNPLAYVDPTGMDPNNGGQTEDEEEQQRRRRPPQPQPKPQPQQQNVPVNIRRTDATYNVAGQTASEAIANAPQQAAAAGVPQQGCENGCTGLTGSNNGYVSYQVNTSSVTATNTATEAEVTLGLAINAVITVTLPTWTGYSSASSDDQKKWDSFVSGVRDHEEGHIQITTETIQAQAKALQALPTTFTAAGTTAQAAVDRAGQIAKTRVRIAVGVAGLVGNDRHYQYDKVTRHGIVSRSNIVY